MTRLSRKICDPLFTWARSIFSLVCLNNSCQHRLQALEHCSAFPTCEYIMFSLPHSLSLGFFLLCFHLHTGKVDLFAARSSLFPPLLSSLSLSLSGSLAQDSHYVPSFSRIKNINEHFFASSSSSLILSLESLLFPTEQNLHVLNRFAIRW